MSAQAPDGSPVAVYLRLPPGDTPALIDTAITPGASILELGCGVGRVTHPLVALGHAVTAVDNSPEMLAYVRGARTVLADVTTLRLEERFDVALLASHFINAPTAKERQALFDVCAYHAPVALIERYAVDWVSTAVPSVRTIGDVTISLDEIERVDAGFRAAITYTVDDQSWTQRFSGAVLDDAQLIDEAASARLMFDAWLDDEHTWARLLRRERSRLPRPVR